MELQPGTPVRMRSGTEGWVKGTVVEYFDIIPSVGGVIYTGPGYKVQVLEGKHKGQELRLPANYVEPLKGFEASPELSRLNTQYSTNQLKSMAKDAQISPTGLKEDLIRRLVEKGILK
jgi:hypothetical protein